MKKIILLLGISGLTMFNSCSSTSQVASQTETLFKGNWTLTDVHVEGIDQRYVKATILDEAEAECYKGSQWYFVKNNNSGTYTLNGQGKCPSGTNSIKWFVTDEGGASYFNFKRTTGAKAKQITTGYKMRVDSNTGNSMTLNQEAPFEGKKINIIYTFIKN